MGEQFVQALQSALIQAQDILNSIIVFLPRLLIGLLVGLALLFIASRIRRIGSRVADRVDAPPAVEELIVNAVYFVALIIAGIITLAVLGVDVFGLVAGLGVGGLVVGFALKEIIENLISGVLILIQRPFQPGDVIEVDGSTGTVQRVELRATVIRTFDNVEVNIPNRIVYTSVVKNFSIYPTRRFEVTVRMQRTQDLAAVRQRLITAVRKVVGVAETPAPSVLFEDLNWAIARGKVYYHVQINQRPIEDVRNEVLVAVSTVLDSQ